MSERIQMITHWKVVNLINELENGNLRIPRFQRAYEKCGDRPRESLIFQGFPDVGPVDTLCLGILCWLPARW